MQPIGPRVCLASVCEECFAHAVPCLSHVWVAQLQPVRVMQQHNQSAQKPYTRTVIQTFTSQLLNPRLRSCFGFLKP